MGVVDIVGGKVGIMPPDRDYKPAEPYRRDMPTLTRDSNLPQGPSRRRAAEQNREAVLWALEQIGGQATTARVVNVLNDTQPGANRKVGQTLRNLVGDGLVENVPTIGEESVWALPGMAPRKDVPEFPPPLAKNPPRTERDDYWRKMRDAITWALKELGGEGKAGDIIIALGAKDNKTDRLRIGIQARLLESEGILQRVGVDHQKVTTWALVTETENKDNEEKIKDVDNELATEVMLADLKKRMAKPELPANSDRMIVELRGVARQFQEIGASEVLLNDFRLLADWIEELNND